MHAVFALNPMRASFNWIAIGLGNGLSSVQNQVRAWTNRDLFSIETKGTNVSKLQLHSKTFLSKEVHTFDSDL